MVIISTPYKTQLVEAKKAKEAKKAEQQAWNPAQGQKAVAAGDVVQQ